MQGEMLEGQVLQMDQTSVCDMFTITQFEVLEGQVLQMGQTSV